MSGTDCCSVHSMVIWRVSRPTSDPGGQNGRLEGAIDEAERRQVDGIATLRQTRLAGGRLEPADPLERGGHDVDVEFDAAIRVDRRLDHRADGLRQHRHLRTEEALILVELAGR